MRWIFAVFINLIECFFVVPIRRPILAREVWNIWVGAIVLPLIVHKVKISILEIHGAKGLYLWAFPPSLSWETPSSFDLDQEAEIFQ